MPTPTYTLLDSVTLTSSATEVIFSGIAAGGDLVLVSSIKTSSATNSRIQFNGDTGSNYSLVNMSGEGSTAASSTNTTLIALNFRMSSSTTEANLSSTQISDYSATDKHKSVLIRNGSADRQAEAIAARWANTAAITSIRVHVILGNMGIGSTFHLYEIAKAL
jgi:hypothetical protein